MCFCLNNYSGWRRLSLKLIFGVLPWGVKKTSMDSKERKREGKEDADYLVVSGFFFQVCGVAWRGVLRIKWRSISSISNIEWVRNNISCKTETETSHFYRIKISRNWEGSKIFIYFPFARKIELNVKISPNILFPFLQTNYFMPFQPNFFIWTFFQFS